jgi:hypothetical protein
VGLPQTIASCFRLLLLLAALLMSGRAGLAADMPGTGSKNFTPPNGTPSYFTDENGQVKGGGAATAPADTEEHEEAAPASAEPHPAIASQEEGGRPAAASERLGGKRSHRYTRAAHHGGRQARYAHGRSSTRHTASLRRHETHGRATAHAARSGHPHGSAHAGGSRTGSAKAKTVHLKPRSKKQHAEHRPMRVLDSA